MSKPQILTINYKPSIEIKNKFKLTTQLQERLQFPIQARIGDDSICKSLKKEIQLQHIH